MSLNLELTNKTLWRIVVGVALVMLGLRLALPGWLTHQINRELVQIGPYQGQVEDVDLFLSAGAYTLKNIRITKRGENIPVPFIVTPRMDIALSWRELLRGHFVAQVEIFQPEFNFVDDRGAATQSGLGVNWRAQLERLVPMRLDTVEIHDGVVSFRNFSTRPEVDIRATEVQANVLNLANIRQDNDRAAECHMTALVLGQARLQADCALDPIEPLGDFMLKVRLDDLELPRLNEFLQAYARLDVESGHGEFVMELEARDDRLKGYIKPLFRDIQIFSWKHDIEEQKDNPFRAAWEAIAGGIENLFQNQKEDQFATRVEIQGTIGDPDTGTAQAIGGIIKNAFKEAYPLQFEGLPKR